MDIIDRTIFDFLSSFTHRFAWLDSFTVFAAKDLIWFWVIILLLVAVIFFRHRKIWEATLFSASAAVISWSASELLKIIFSSNRPFVDLPAGSTLLTYSTGGDAFPSSHATFLFALAIGIYFYNKTLGTISLLVALLVSLARVATGLRWPIDVLGGFILALIISLLLHYLFSRRSTSHKFV